MIEMLKGLLRALLALPGSKKFVVLALGALLQLVLRGPEWEETRNNLVMLFVAAIGAMGLADWGKEAAKVSPSLAPPKLVPSATPGGVLQAVDAEDPK